MSMLARTAARARPKTANFDSEFARDVIAGLSASPKLLWAKYFYDETNAKLDRVTAGRVRVKNVTVFETDTTTATYSEP